MHRKLFPFHSLSLNMNHDTNGKTPFVPKRPGIGSWERLGDDRTENSAQRSQLPLLVDYANVIRGRGGWMYSQIGGQRSRKNGMLRNSDFIAKFQFVFAHGRRSGTEGRPRRWISPWIEKGRIFGSDTRPPKAMDFLASHLPLFGP